MLLHWEIISDSAPELLLNDFESTTMVCSYWKVYC